MKTRLIRLLSYLVLFGGVISICGAAPQLSDARVGELKKAFPAAETRKFGKSFDYQVPAPDVWSRYRGDFWVLTAGNAASQLPRIEANIAAEEEAMKQRSMHGENASGRDQAGATVEWIRGKLRPYLARWKAAAGIK